MVDEVYTVRLPVRNTGGVDYIEVCMVDEVYTVRMPVKDTGGFDYVLVFRGGFLSGNYFSINTVNGECVGFSVELRKV